MTYYRPVFRWGVLVSLIYILCVCQAGGRDTAASEKATRDKVIHPMISCLNTHPARLILPIAPT